jgi:hypothetical protein
MDDSFRLAPDSVKSRPEGPSRPTVDLRVGGIYLQKTGPILRDAKGHFIGLGPAELISPRPMLGRFARFLPDCAPSGPGREGALKALATIGVRIPRCQDRGL